MALAPISSVRLTPPARPSGPAERIAVPGNPQAEPARPATSPGRIPVPQQSETAHHDKDMVERVDEEVRKSREYQLIRAYIRREREQDDDHVETEKKEAIDRREPPPAGTPPPPAELPPQAEGQPSGEPRTSDPLALDLDGNGLQTTGIDKGVRFDIDADGRLDKTSFIAGGDAFVALDRNGNGLIDDGRELFGDQTGHANGFVALAVHDDNGDGRIDSQDTVYDQLRLLRINADGSQQLTGLQESGVASINLGYISVDRAINRYDSVAQAGGYTRTDGTEGEAGDLLLGYRDPA